ncbi:serine hydrolase [Streptomyces luteireticuli]|uniref:serine hydrolase n=1 Tax=Streptomyces luteireticuli TaxID=173858 RepID=UPI003556FD2C
MLAFGTGTAFAAALGSAPEAFAADRPERAAGAGITAALERLEATYTSRLGVPVRLGVFAYSPAGGNPVCYRETELFPMCSTFKTLAVGAVLQGLRTGDGFLHERIRYTEQDTKSSGYAPITGLAENLRDGMTGADLCGNAA